MLSVFVCLQFANLSFQRKLALDGHYLEVNAHRDHPQRATMLASLRVAASQANNGVTAPLKDDAADQSRIRLPRIAEKEDFFSFALHCIRPSIPQTVDLLDAQKAYTLHSFVDVQVLLLFIVANSIRYQNRCSKQLISCDSSSKRVAQFWLLASNRSHRRHRHRS